MNKEPAPILLFCYKRLDVLKSTIMALQKNDLASESKLYIFSDGAKSSADLSAVENVRAYLKTITGFLSITLFEATENKGLASSIIGGVSKIFERYDRVIVLEDDLVTSSNFLSFMNQALSFYEKMNVFSIAGFSFPVEGVPQNAVYFTKRASSWGWATWKNRWETVDWEVKDYAEIKQNHRLRREFNKMGTDLAGMLDKQMSGKIDSWAIKWCYHQFKMQSYTVHPAISKVQNIGFGSGATHTRESSGRYTTNFDQSGNTRFQFSSQLQLESQVIRQITKHFSISFRSYYKVLNLLSQTFEKFHLKKA